MREQKVSLKLVEPIRFSYQAEGHTYDLEVQESSCVFSSLWDDVEDDIWFRQGLRAVVSTFPRFRGVNIRVESSNARYTIKRRRPGNPELWK